MKTLKTISLATLMLVGTIGSLSAKSGKQVYATTCFACHGNNGKGKVPGAPNFTTKSKYNRLAKSDRTLIRHMIKGFQSRGSRMAMPPKGGNPSLRRSDFVKVLKFMRKKFAPHTLKK